MKKRFWNNVPWTNVYWGERKKLNVIFKGTRVKYTDVYLNRQISGLLDLVQRNSRQIYGYLFKQTNQWTSRPTKRVYWVDAEFSVSTFRPYAEWVPINNFAIPGSNSCVHLTMEDYNTIETPRSESVDLERGPPTVSLRERVLLTNGKRRRWQPR